MALYLQNQRNADQAGHALEAYLSRITPIVRDSVRRYARCLRLLDKRAGGLLSNPATVQRLRLPLPSGQTLLDYFENAGRSLDAWLTDLDEAPAEQSLKLWQRLLDDPNEYRSFMTRLIHQFGNYEMIALALPGMGPIITDRRLQATMSEMFAIKRRLIRLLELAYSVRRAWLSDPPTTSLSFFDPEVDLGRLVRGMLAEYMVQADPERIAAGKKRAERKGRRHTRYRFWRPAEALRQMAGVTYKERPGRVPRPTNRYVDLRLAATPAFCADLTRLNWAVKELFNNAIAATTRVTISDDGQRVEARPIPKHDCPNPPSAITLTVKPITMWQGLRRTRGSRLVISDDGIGIDPKVLPHVTLWAFSTHRDWIDDDPDRLISEASLESKQMLIGGKGIGLAFARATIEELGGRLTISSAPDKGTVVTIDIPVPTLR